MQKTFLFILLLMAIFINATAQQPAATSNKPAQVSQFPSDDAFKNKKIIYQLIPAANHTWCYDIYVDGRLTIHQPSIPGLSGNEGFKTKKKAGRVAELVAGKIKRGEMPPTVTIEEMKNLQVI